MPKGSNPGERRGGRQKGTSNKRMAELHALAVDMMATGASPLDFLTRVYRDETLAMDLRIDAAAKVAPYLHPRLSATTLSGDAEGPIRVTILRLGDKAASDKPY